MRCLRKCRWDENWKISLSGIGGSKFGGWLTLGNASVIIIDTFLRFSAFSKKMVLFLQMIFLSFSKNKMLFFRIFYLTSNFPMLFCDTLTNTVRTTPGMLSFPISLFQQSDSFLPYSKTVLFLVDGLPLPDSLCCVAVFLLPEFLGCSILSLLSFKYSTIQWGAAARRRKNRWFILVFINFIPP